MAGYFIDGCHLDDTPDQHVHGFHIDDVPALIVSIRANTQSHVLTLQVDGDELDAVLWGLTHYVKGVGLDPLGVHS